MLGVWVKIRVGGDRGAPSRYNIFCTVQSGSRALRSGSAEPSAEPAAWKNNLCDRGGPKPEPYSAHSRLRAPNLSRASPQTAHITRTVGLTPGHAGLPDSCRRRPSNSQDRTLHSQCEPILRSHIFAHSAHGSVRRALTRNCTL